jgi:putative ABC transport system permease protein
VSTLVEPSPSHALPAPWRQWLSTTVTGPLWQAPWRTLVAIVAVALGVALGLAVHLINRVAADEVQLAARSLFGIADLSVQGAGRGLDETLYPALARLPMVAVASPVLDIRARLPDRGRTLQLLGVDPFRVRELQAPLAALGATAIRTTGLLAENVVWLSPAAAEALALEPGDELRVQAGLSIQVLEVAGLLPAAAYRQQLGMLDIAEAQQRFGRLGRLDRIDLRLVPGSDLAVAREAIAAKLPAGARLVTPGEAGDDALRLSQAYRTNLTALALVALFTGAFLVYSTQMLVVARRRREIAFLHAMGLTVREQLWATLLGGAIVGVAGAAVGIALGIVAARAGLAAFGADLGAGYFRGLAPSLAVPVLDCVVFFVLGVMAAIGGSVAPALEAASVPPAAALRSGSRPDRPVRSIGAADWLSAIGSEWRQGLLLWAIAGVLVWLSTSPEAFLGSSPFRSEVPWSGYLAIGCLLIGAVRMAPALARAVLDRLPRGGPAWREIATAQLRGTARSTAISLAAVLVSFGLMVAMAIMVQSFRESLDTWLQRILPADLYLRAGSSGTSAYLDAETQRRLAALPGVARIDFQSSTEVGLEEGAPRVTVMAREVDASSASRLLPLRREARLPLPADAVPVWVSEAALDLHGLDVDRIFDLPLGERSVRASVRGVWRDYDRPGGAIVLARSTYVEATGDARATGASLWLEPGVLADSVSAALRDALPGGGVVEIARPREIRQRSLEVFDRTFAVTYVIEAIAVLIGLVGISAAIGTQVLARRSEFGMLRHVGVLRREIAGLLAFEGAVQGALGVAGGLAVGGLVSLILIYVVNRQSFHWTMDLHVPWATLGVLTALLVSAAAATAALSGRSSMGPDVVRAVREDW